MIDPMSPTIRHLVALGYNQVSEHAYWRLGSPTKFSVTASDPATKVTLRGWGRSADQAWADLCKRAGLTIPEPGPAPVPTARRERRARAALEIGPPKLS